MPIKFQCDVCMLTDGELDPLDNEGQQRITVDQVVIITLDSEGRKIPNTAKDKLYLCKGCSGPYFKLTRGLEMKRMRDFIRWYREVSKKHSEEQTDANNGNI